eukprot:417596-Prorocentrum_minimum.AAC.1
MLPCDGDFAASDARCFPVTVTLPPLTVKSTMPPAARGAGPAARGVLGRRGRARHHKQGEPNGHRHRGGHSQGQAE